MKPPISSNFFQKFFSSPFQNYDQLSPVPFPDKFHLLFFLLYSWSIIPSYPSPALQSPLISLYLPFLITTSYFISLSLLLNPFSFTPTSFTNENLLPPYPCLCPSSPTSFFSFPFILKSSFFVLRSLPIPSPAGASTSGVGMAENEGVWRKNRFR